MKGPEARAVKYAPNTICMRASYENLLAAARETGRANLSTTYYNYDGQDTRKLLQVAESDSYPRAASNFKVVYNKLFLGELRQTLALEQLFCHYLDDTRLVLTCPDLVEQASFAAELRKRCSLGQGQLVLKSLSSISTSLLFNQRRLEILASSLLEQSLLRRQSCKVTLASPDQNTASLPYYSLSYSIIDGLIELILSLDFQLMESMQLKSYLEAFFQGLRANHYGLSFGKITLRVSSYPSMDISTELSSSSGQFLADTTIMTIFNLLVSPANKLSFYSDYIALDKTEKKTVLSSALRAILKDSDFLREYGALESQFKTRLSQASKNFAALSTLNRGIGFGMSKLSLDSCSNSEAEDLFVFAVSKVELSACSNRLRILSIFLCLPCSELVAENRLQQKALQEWNSLLKLWNFYFNSQLEVSRAAINIQFSLVDSLAYRDCNINGAIFSALNMALLAAISQCSFLDAESLHMPIQDSILSPLGEGGLSENFF